MGILRTWGSRKAATGAPSGAQQHGNADAATTSDVNKPVAKPDARKPSKAEEAAKTLIPDFLGEVTELYVDTNPPQKSIMSNSYHYLIKIPVEKGSSGASRKRLGKIPCENDTPFTADICDVNGQKILKVERGKKFAASEMYVYAYPLQADEPVRVLAKVEKNYGRLHHRYIVSIALSEDKFGDLFQLEAGVIRDWTFSVKDGSGQERAVVWRRPDECVQPWQI